MMLADYLHTLPTHALADIYDTLYSPGVPVLLSEEGYRNAITDYWNDPDHWKELVEALSPSERQRMTRLALHERCPIDAFMEELSQLGLIALYRESNRYELFDDIRVQLLERLPSIQDLLEAQGQGGTDESTGI
jgi:hypothetical protein